MHSAIETVQAKRSQFSPFPPTLVLLTLLTAAHLRGQCTHSWHAVGAGTNGEVRAMTRWDPDGAGPLPEVVVVGGAFTTAGGIPTSGAAAYDPVLGSWSGMGLPSVAVVNSLAVLANGTLVASGDHLGPSFGKVVVAFDGVAWSPIVPIGTDVKCMLPMPNGDLVVGGHFQSIGGVPALGVARWSGTSWSPIPGLALVTILGGSDIEVRHLARLANGDLVASGLFNCSGGQYLARWNGAAWTSINPFPGILILDVRALLALPSGGLVAGVNGVQRWDGANWSSLGNLSFGPDVTALTVAPNGDVIAGGTFPDGVARWNGTTWSPFAGGTAAGTKAFVWEADQDLLVGGSFASAGCTGSPRIARLTTSCPAAVTSLGTGCAGAGGLDELSAVTLPWIGSTFRAHAVGMPVQAFVLSVYGLAPLSIPFASVFPQALAGCTILMSGDLIDVLSPVAGAVDTRLPLPNAPGLVGAMFHHYVVPFEVDAMLNVTTITNSNALTCTVGAF